MNDTNPEKPGTGISTPSHETGAPRLPDPQQHPYPVAGAGVPSTLPLSTSNLSSDMRTGTSTRTTPRPGQRGEQSGSSPFRRWFLKAASPVLPTTPESSYPETSTGRPPVGQASSNICGLSSSDPLGTKDRTGLAETARGGAGFRTRHSRTSGLADIDCGAGGVNRDHSGRISGDRSGQRTAGAQHSGPVSPRRFLPTQHRCGVGAGLTLPGIGPAWAVILHIKAQAGPKVRTTLFQSLQKLNPVRKFLWGSRRASRVPPFRPPAFHLSGPRHGYRPLLWLSPPVKTRKRRLGAGLPVLMVSLTWLLLLHSAVQAGPETRITTTPRAAHEPPARIAAQTTGETAKAGTTTDLLTFIRALEAPRGYTDYERRIRIPPPKPLTAMTVGEVLDWQVRVRRFGAPSTAAGGYQIIYPTLKRLVNKYGISRDRVFDARLQDHLARLLTGECGRRGPKRNHPRYGNCLAGIWAALPLTHGPNRGRSAYQGVAGNRALTHPDIVLDLLAGLPVTLPTYRTRQPLNPAQAAQALRRIGNSIGNRPLAFGASRITVEEINTALRKARRDNTLTPPIKTWKRDPYAQN